MASQDVKKSDSKEVYNSVTDPNEESFEPHEEISDMSESTGKATPFVYVIVISVCLGAFLFGYDTGVISGALIPLSRQYNLGSVQQEVLVGVSTAGSIVSGFSAGLLSDRFGRKILVIVSSIIFIAGALILPLAPNYGVLIFGRIIVGIAVGIASMIVPVYISEVSPKQIRGRLTSLNTLVITFGQVIAYVINIAFANVPEGWRYMFGLAGIPALLQLVIMPFLPESPRRLIAIGKLNEAKKAIRKIYGDSVTETFIDREIKMIDDDIHTSHSGSFRDFLRRDNFMPLIIACILQAAQQLSGFNAAMYYAATILKMAGFRSDQGSTSVAIIVAITNMVFTAIAVGVIDKAGRRKMLLFTMLSMVGGLIALGATFAAQQGFVTSQPTCGGYSGNCARCVIDSSCGWSSSQSICIPLAGNAMDIFQSNSGCPTRPQDMAITGVMLMFLVVYVGSYALGLGYIPWLAQSEMFPMSIRGKANGIATAVNWICNLIISTTFLSMTNAMTAAGTFWFYAGISIILWFMLIRLMPETSGKSLEEIHEYFLKS